jgi:hypothetical protein
MANITYRETVAPTVPVSTVAKGSPLSNLEIDANMKSLDNDIQSRTTVDDAIKYSIALG